MVHGRGRNTDSLDDTYFGVHEELLYARKIKPVEGTIFPFFTRDSLIYLGLNNKSHNLCSFIF